MIQRSLGNNKGIRRGQVWWLKPDMERTGHIQSGSRPVIIVSNDVCNFYSDVVHVCPCTTSVKKAYPIQVPFILRGRVNLALADQILPVNIYELANKIGVVEEHVMDRIGQAIKWQLGIEPLPDTRFDNRPASSAPAQPIGHQIDKFNKKWGPKQDPETASRRRLRNIWTEEYIQSYITDYATMELSAVCDKYGLASSSAIKYYSKFTKGTIKGENCNAVS